MFGAAILAATAVTGTGAGQGRAHAPDRELDGLPASGFAETQSFGRPDAYRRALLTRLDPTFATLTAEETTGLLYMMDGSPLGAHYLPIFSGARARWIAVVTGPANRRRFAEERDRRTSSDRAFWLGVTTPAATARLLEAIERCTLHAGGL